MSKKFTPKKVWNKIFPQTCSKCGGKTMRYYEFSKDSDFYMDRKKGLAITKAKKDVKLCEECFRKWDFLKGGSVEDFMKEFGKLFKES